jgi:hypothetical protein
MLNQIKQRIEEAKKLIPENPLHYKGPLVVLIAIAETLLLMAQDRGLRHGEVGELDCKNCKKKTTHTFNAPGSSFFWRCSLCRNQVCV